VIDVRALRSPQFRILLRRQPQVNPTPARLYRVLEHLRLSESRHAPPREELYRRRHNEKDGKRLCRPFPIAVPLFSLAAVRISASEGTIRISHIFYLNPIYMHIHPL
jgi:hypothetical protein